MEEFTHFDQQGNAVMVDVSGKSDTVREARERENLYEQTVF